MKHLLNSIRAWLQKHYQTVVNSIAFYPALITLSFLSLSVLLVIFDFSEAGRHFKSRLHWFSLKDAETARTIVSAIVTGIISLTVFSFSMVMIVLNQAASQMSNRVLRKMIGNRFQQVVLGIYIGTVVYALFLLSTIRSIDSGVSVPALSTYLLIAITAFDIFLFIYFLHYITQSVKYEVVIRKIHRQTTDVLSQTCHLQREPEKVSFPESHYPVFSAKAGIYEGLDTDTLLSLCEENDCLLQLLHTPGTFLLKGIPLLMATKPLPAHVDEAVLEAIPLTDEETIERNFLHGFRQLTEVAIKALSPGINDPGTAVVSLQALFQLFAYRGAHFPDPVIKDEKGRAKIFTREMPFEKIVTDALHPVWNYGKSDPMVQQALLHLLNQLQACTPNATVDAWLQKVKAAIKEPLLKPLDEYT